MTARFRFSNARCGAGVMIVVALLSTDSAIAQLAEATAEADRQSLENLALARARTRLYEHAMTLPVGAKITIGDWVTGEIGRHRALRMWARTLPRSGDARVYSDATCDVDVRVAPDELLTSLMEIADKHTLDVDSPLTAADITKASREWSTLWSTGTAALAEKTDACPPPG